MATFPIFALAALGLRAVAELALTRTRLGAVSTTMFVTALFGSLAIGHLVDRVGTRRVLTGPFACSSAAVALMASADSFGRLLLAWIVAGFAQASANPSTNSVVDHHIARAHRGTVMGIKQAGVPMAQSLPV